MQIDFEMLNKKTGLLFLFTEKEVENLIETALIFYQAIIVELEKENTKAAIIHIAHLSEYFFKKLFEKKQLLSFILGYRILAAEFMGFIRDLYENDKNNPASDLSDNVYIQYLRTYRYLTQEFTDRFIDLSETLWEEEENNLFAKLYLLHPFISAALPISENKLLTLKENITNFNSSEEKEIKEHIEKNILKNNPNDLNKIKRALNVIQNRLRTDYKHCWIKWLYESPERKIQEINKLCKMLNKKTPLNKFSKALEKTAENKTITAHRSRIKKLFWGGLFKPAKTSDELKKIFYSQLAHTPNSYIISHALRNA